MTKQGIPYLIVRSAIDSAAASFAFMTLFQLKGWDMSALVFTGAILIAVIIRVTCRICRWGMI